MNGGETKKALAKGGRRARRASDRIGACQGKIKVKIPTLQNQGWAPTQMPKPGGEAGAREGRNGIAPLQGEGGASRSAPQRQVARQARRHKTQRWLHRPKDGALKGRRYRGKTRLGEQAEKSFVAGPKELYGASCAGLDAPLPEEEIGGEAKGNVDQEQA